MLYYGDSAANGLKASDYVEELKSQADFDRFIDNQDEKVFGTVLGIYLAGISIQRSWQLDCRGLSVTGLLLYQPDNGCSSVMHINQNRALNMATASQHCDSGKLECCSDKQYVSMLLPA